MEQMTNDDKLSAAHFWSTCQVRPDSQGDMTTPAAWSWSKIRFWSVCQSIFCTLCCGLSICLIPSPMTTLILVTLFQYFHITHRFFPLGSIQFLKWAQTARTVSNRLRNFARRRTPFFCSLLFIYIKIYFSMSFTEGLLTVSIFVENHVSFTTPQNIMLLRVLAVKTWRNWHNTDTHLVKMTPTILLLLTVTVAMDLASVSKQAKMVEMLRNRPPPEPLTLEARRQAADLKSVTLTGDCAAQFNTVSRKSLARSVAVTCAKIEKLALSNVDLAKATNPIPAYMRFCRSAQLANNFASHVQDVIGM